MARPAGLLLADGQPRGRPILLVVSTPAHCVGQFCGPITEMIGQLADLYADRATFIHIEVWKDFAGSVFNDAAREWIAPNQICHHSATGRGWR